MLCVFRTILTIISFMNATTRFASAILSISLLGSLAIARDLRSAPINLIGLLPANSSHLIEAYVLTPAQALTPSENADSLVIKKSADGTVRILRNGKNGEVDDLEEMYNPDGSLRFSRRYVHGVLQGTETVYQSDGKGRLIEIPWKTGHVDGDVAVYYPDGSQRIRMHYIQDTLNGTSQTFWPGGKLLSQVEYKLGKANGVALHYTPEGTVFARSVYYQGNCIRVTHLDVAGADHATALIGEMEQLAFAPISHLE